jgi:predicted O-linked N-acetylglucosamine transferase (SPINDLY family)
LPRFAKLSKMQILQRDLPTALEPTSAPPPSESVPADAFQRGRHFLAHGHRAEAFACWFHALVYQPHRVDLLLSLGTACRDMGWEDYAELFCRQALQAGTGLTLAAAHTNLGNLLVTQARWDEAQSHFSQALAIAPGLVAAQRGTCEFALHQGDLAAATRAIESFAQLSGAPAAELAYLRGRVANLSAKTDLARDWLLKAITYQPDHRRAWRELAISASSDDVASVLMQQLIHLNRTMPDALEIAARVALTALLQSGFEEAVPEFLANVRALLANALPLYESAAAALYHAGCSSTASRLCRDTLVLPAPSAFLLELAAIIHAQQGRAEEARQFFSRALHIAPANTSLLNNISYFLLQLHDIDGAILFAQRALAVPDRSGRSHLMLAMACVKIFRLSDAIGACREGLRLREIAHATRADLWHEMGYALLNQGRHQDATDAIRLANELSQEHSSSAYAFTHLYRSDISADVLAEVHRAAGACYAEPFASRRHTSWPNTRSPNRKLRVGLVSADFFHHPVGLLLASWITHVDQQQFELFAYATSQRRDSISARIEAGVTCWRPVHRDAVEAIAELIASDAIDILIDLSGHTEGTKLGVFALKPAPVQLAWAGYVFSSGLETIDGVIHDRFSAPPESDQYYVERVLRLPCMTYCYVPPDPLLPVSPTPALGRGYITFGCFNHVPKLTQHTLSLWAKVLHALPTARLYLKAGPFADSAVQEDIRGRLHELGIARERVRIEGPSPFAEYLAAYDEVDIALDTYPFNGGVTSLQGLWQGVPVLTRAGSLHLSRVGGSMMHALNLSSWVAETDDQFVAAAIAKALDFEQLNRTRLRLRERLATCPLGNGKLFAARMEQLWRECWYAYCRQTG